MLQFRTLRSYQQDEANQTKEYASDVVPPNSPITTSPVGVAIDHYPVITTEQLEVLTQQKRQAEAEPPTTSPLSKSTTTQSLLTALQSTMAPVTGKQRVVIPGEKKRTKTTQKMATRRMRTSVRFGIVLSSIIVVMIITLFSLSPLSSGQHGSSLFSSVANWVHTQQQNWGLIGQQGTDTKQNPTVNLVPMTLPKSQYVAIARQDAIDAGINPDYFVRQINQESGFNPNAISPAGAVGIAQFLPSTAAGLGFNPYDPIASLKAAAQYMASYAKQYGGDYAKALAAYNAGSGTVNNAVRLGGANWMNYLPAETRNYIAIIMGI